MNNRFDDTVFESLADAPAPQGAAPARLKSRIYSALMQAEAQQGPLRSVTETENAGRRLCVFEKLVEITPVGTSAKGLNFCRVCHARLLGENLAAAPIYWPNCPYAAFHHPPKPQIS